MKNNVETLAKASKDLMLAEPFYGLLLMSLNKQWSDKKVPTAGVGLNGINYELIINPTFWEALPQIKKKGILKHELLHIAFFHLTDYSNYKDKQILNIAMDLEINQLINRDWLPEEGCFLENFPELNLEPRKGTRYYYKKLKEKQDQNDDDMQAIMDAIAKATEGDGEKNDDGTGTPVELPNGQKIMLPNHDWKDVENLPEATKKLIETQTAHIVTQVADQVTKAKGDIPGEFSELLKRLLHVEPPKFDWKGYMRRFAGKSIKTYTKKSRRKYNKRIPENPGMKIKRQKHILFAIDTSGSVSTSELKEALGELYHMQKTGSDVTIIQCDTAISHVGKYDPKMDLHIHGRGGTEYQPVIDYYNEHQKDYSCLMYFTDGECYAPDNVKGNVLWVLSSRGDDSYLKDANVGEIIKLPTSTN